METYQSENGLAMVWDSHCVVVRFELNLHHIPSQWEVDCITNLVAGTDGCVVALLCSIEELSLYSKG